MATTKAGDLADQLRHRIEAGEFPPGSVLPAERTLASNMGVSRATAQGALKKLVNHGLVIARHGVGYEVRSDSRLRWIATDHERGDELGGPAPNDSWSRQIRLQGRVPSEKIVAVEHVPAEDKVAAWLEVEPGTDLVVRRRLRYVDDRPLMIADSYYLAADVAGTPIEQPGDVQPGVFKIFERMGRPWNGHRRDRVRTRKPTVDEARALELPDGSSVAQVARISRDRNGAPVRLSVFVVSDEVEIEFDYEEQ